MQEYVYFKTNGKYSRVCISDILYIECLKKYAKIVTSRNSHLVTASMCCLEKQLPPDLFCRIHRSYIVSLRHAAQFDYEMVYIADPAIAIPIGKHYKGVLQQRLFVISGDEKDTDLISFDNDRLFVA